MPPLSHEVIAWYTANHYSLFWPNKTIDQKLFDIIGTQIYNLLVSNLVNKQLPQFKKHISRWLIEYDATNFEIRNYKKPIKLI